MERFEGLAADVPGRDSDSPSLPDLDNFSDPEMVDGLTFSSDEGGSSTAAQWVDLPDFTDEELPPLEIEEPQGTRESDIWSEIEAVLNAPSPPAPQHTAGCDPVVARLAGKMQANPSLIAMAQAALSRKQHSNAPKRRRRKKRVNPDKLSAEKLAERRANGAARTRKCRAKMKELKKLEQAARKVLMNEVFVSES